MKNNGILNGNHLKLIAAFCMLLGHASLLLFPQVRLLRVLGRLAYPIFAFMIAEGCRYTRNKLRYFRMIFSLGAVCQTIYYCASGNTYLNILLTFSLSILLIYLLQAAHGAKDWKKQFLWSALFAAGIFIALEIDRFLTIDYGFWGVMTPVLASFALIRKFPHWASVLLLGAGLLMLGADLGGVQHYALLALPLLLLYNGQRGKVNMKYFFYIFYPVHLVVLQGITWLVR